MPSFTDFMVVIGMIALRFGIPALAIAGIAFLFKRLDRRWEAEAHEYAAKQAAEQPAVQPEAPRPAERPAIPTRKPTPAPLPFIIPPAAPKDTRVQLQAGMAMPSAAPASEKKSTAANQKAACSAAQGGDQSCWQTRFTAEGHIPDECINCDVFQRYPTV